MTREIQLTQGKVALVDDGMFEYLSQWKWCAMKSGNNFYAARAGRRLDGERFQKIIYMHREIAKTPEGMLTDHRNHNTLDNHDENLRKCTNQQNQANQKIKKGGTSRYKGVFRQRGKKSFRSKIKVNGVAIYGGSFEIEEEAALSYDEMAIEYYGDFARTNFNYEDI